VDVMKKPGLDWLCRELLASPYSYALCLKEHAFKREMRRLKIPKRSRPHYLNSPTANATVHFFEKTNDIDKCAIVCLGRIPKATSREQVYGILVHEAVHIWQACRDDLGEKYPASEQEAYAIQRIAQSLMHSYTEQVE
jgi:hypothetical protein